MAKTRKFRIQDPIYGITVLVGVGLDFQKEADKFCREVDAPFMDIPNRANAVTVVSYNKHNCAIILLPKIPRSPYELGTLAHECLHVTFWALFKCNVDITTDMTAPNEAFCYYHQWLIQEILSTLRK